MATTFPSHTGSHIEQKRSAAAIVAIVAAIAGVIVTGTGHPYWGLLIGAVAIVSGLVGLALSTSNRVSGAVMSFSAIVLAVIGLIFSILVAIGILIF